MVNCKFIMLVVLVFVSFLFSAVTEDRIKMIQKDVPNVYIDCWYCDMDYIRTEIQYVNYVLDRKDADIHILFTREQTASGGREFTLTFLGKNHFAGLRDTISYSTRQDNTDDIIRKKMVRYLNIGLMRYIAHTTQADHISIRYNRAEEKKNPTDAWDYWVFRTSLSSYFTGQKSYNIQYLNFNQRADRITDDWKIRLRLSLNYGEDNYQLDDETFSSYSRMHQVSALIIKSVSNHWSIGINSRIYTSTFLNIDRAIKVYPAIEYNIFPYSESTRSELRFLYEVGYGYFNYDGETIYNKKKESLFEESLEITLKLNQPWGSIETSLTGSHYFFDFSKNSLEAYSELSLNLIKGFSLELSGSYSMIHDQLSLQKSAVSQEEVILRRRQLETQYNYWGSVGINYTFGSIYNNIVNSRFGN